MWIAFGCRLLSCYSVRREAEDSPGGVLHDLAEHQLEDEAGGRISGVEHSYLVADLLLACAAAAAACIEAR